MGIFKTSTVSSTSSRVSSFMVTSSSYGSVIKLLVTMAVPMYLNQIKEYCTEISDEPLAGDILVYKFHGALVPHHASVVLNNEYIIHSLVREGVVQSNRRGYEKYRVATYRFNRWVGGD